MRKGLLIPVLVFLVWPLISQEARVDTKDKGYEISKDFKQANVASWTKILSPLKGKPDINYLEVGVAEGGSFFWMLDNIFTDKTNKAYAMDIFAGEYHNVFLRNLEKSGHSQRVTVIKEYSQKALRALPLSYFDVIYIDGDHRAPAVLSDAIMSWSLLREGGFLIFDDYRLRLDIPEDLRPKAAIDSFLTAFRNDLRVVQRRRQMICRKRGSRYPKDSAHHTAFGDYFYVWSVYAYMPEHGLFDRKAKKIPLSSEEESMIQAIIKSRKFGEVEITVDPQWLKNEKFIQLRDKLKLRIIDGVIARPHAYSR